MWLLSSYRCRWNITGTGSVLWHLIITQVHNYYLLQNQYTPVYTNGVYFKTVCQQTENSRPVQQNYILGFSLNCFEGVKSFHYSFPDNTFGLCLCLFCAHNKKISRVGLSSKNFTLTFSKNFIFGASLIIWNYNW